MRQILRYDSVAGWRYIPDITARVSGAGGGYLLRTNRHGFRSAHDHHEPTRHTRLAVYGDSFTAGEGVSDGRRWTDVAERIRAKVSPVEVCNLALPGSGPDQEFMLWRSEQALTRTDAVVVAIWVENIRRVVSRFRWFSDGSGGEKLFAKPWLELESGELVAKGSPPPIRPVSVDELSEVDREHIAKRARLPLARSALDKLRSTPTYARLDVEGRVLQPVQRLARYQVMPEYADPNGHDWKLLQAIVATWRSEWGGPFVIMPLPFHQHVLGISDPTPYQQRFSELAASCDALLIDPLAALQSVSKSERRNLSLPDGHPTANWHAIVGEHFVDCATPLLDELSAFELTTAAAGTTHSEVPR